jgi:TatD DNase family protein
MFDTHAHFEAGTEEIAAQLARAKEAGVARVMAVGGSPALNAGVERAHAAAAAAGVGLWSAVGWDREQIGGALPAIDWSVADAVGEIGLDYFYDPGTREAQRDLFARQLETARSLDLPVVVHSREADDDTIGLLREIPVRGVLHCFTGSPAFCRAVLDLGFYVSYSGIVTLPRAQNVRETVPLVPDDRLLVETDCPFLAPVPMRGKANESAYLAHTVRFLAALKAVSPEALAETTAANARALLGEHPRR